MDTKLEAPTAEPLSIALPALSLAGVGLAYPGRGRRPPTQALADLDLEVAGNEVVALVGPSGCGKSTLLEVICGLQEPDRGSVRVGAASVARERMAECAYMPQRDLLLPWRDALGNAALALECQGVARREARRRAEPLFGRFGLERFERARPGELSGGMRQRIAFLRTLLAGRPVLLLDEPFAALDAITRSSMQEWLAEALAGEPRTVVLVTHDVEEALYLADRVAVLSARPARVAAELPVEIERPRPRRETVTDARFVSLKERAMRALES